LGETYQECDQEAKWEQFMEEAGMQEGKGTEMLMAMELVGEENQVNHMENPISLLRQHLLEDTVKDSVKIDQLNKGGKMLQELERDKEDPDPEEEISEKQ
jgi:hypothetical protein